MKNDGTIQDQQSTFTIEEVRLLVGLELEEHQDKEVINRLMIAGICTPSAIYLFNSFTYPDSPVTEGPAIFLLTIIAVAAVGTFEIIFRGSKLLIHKWGS